MLLYIERWLKAPVEAEDGTLIARDRGTPQGGVISPLLANIFLHHVFDSWMSREYPGCPFERYADDVVIHCKSQRQATMIKAKVEARLRQCRLEAHPDKTRIVYCRDDQRTQDHQHIQFDFLSYTFKPRSARNREGQMFCGFLPAISAKATKAITAEVAAWGIHRMSDKELTDLSRMFNPIIRGWVNYYSRYRPSALRRTLQCVDRRLARWARVKYKRLAARPRRSATWLRRIAEQSSELFAHWKLTIKPKGHGMIGAG
jgi:RNA-directed DNA polymerase